MKPVVLAEVRRTTHIHCIFWPMDLAKLHSVADALRSVAYRLADANLSIFSPVSALFMLCSFKTFKGCSRVCQGALAVQRFVLRPNVGERAQVPGEPHLSKCKAVTVQGSLSASRLLLSWAICAVGCVHMIGRISVSFGRSHGFS
eukprot:2988221-Pleurochrysis_carterae.AAC.1